MGVEPKIPKSLKYKNGKQDSSDEDSSQNVPIGYKFEDNFPLLPGSKPKNPDKKARGLQID